MPAPVVIVVFAMLSFAPTLRNGFLMWDDVTNVTGNPFLNPPTVGNLLHFWTHPYASLYVPVVYSSYCVDLLVAGGASWPFHLFNIMLHSATAVLVYFILSGLLRQDSERFSKRAALIGALVFAVHPIQAEAVSWITGRKDLLSGFFACLAVQVHLVAMTSSKARAESRILVLHLLAFACFLLSMLAKPAAAALPLAILIIDLALLHVRARRALLLMAPWLVVAAVFVVLTSVVQPTPAELYRQFSPVWFRPFLAAHELVFYVRQIIWPFHLAPVYGGTPLQLSQKWWVYAEFVAVTVGLAFVLKKRTRWAAAAGLFIIPVLPVLGLMPFQYQMRSLVADRYVYLSMAAVSLACAWGYEYVEKTQGIKARLLHVISTTAIIGLSFLSFQQGRVWRDNASLWKHAVAVAPNSAIAHGNLGNVHAEAGDRPSAISEYEKAILSDPAAAGNYTNLALCLDESGRFDEGAQQAQKAIDLIRANAVAYRAKQLADACNAKGFALLRLGLKTEAADAFTSAIAIDPTFPDPHVNLGILRLESGEPKGAVTEFTEALNIAPGLSDVRVNLASALLRIGREGEAETELRAVLETDPNHVGARANLGMLLTRLGRKTEALTELRRASELDPSDEQVKRALLQIETSATQAIHAVK